MEARAIRRFLSVVTLCQQHSDTRDLQLFAAAYGDTWLFQTVAYLLRSPKRPICILLRTTCCNKLISGDVIR